MSSKAGITNTTRQLGCEALRDPDRCVALAEQLASRCGKAVKREVQELTILLRDFVETSREQIKQGYSLRRQPEAERLREALRTHKLIQSGDPAAKAVDRLCWVVLAPSRYLNPEIALVSDVMLEAGLEKSAQVDIAWALIASGSSFDDAVEVASCFDV